MKDLSPHNLASGGVFILCVWSLVIFGSAGMGLYGHLAGPPAKVVTASR